MRCPPLHHLNQPMGTLQGPWPPGPTYDIEVRAEHAHARAAVCPADSSAGVGPAQLGPTERKQASSIGTKSNSHTITL